RFCAGDSARYSNPSPAVRNKRSRQFEAQRMFTSEPAEDARIPTPSAPSIEANGSDLVAIYVVLFHVGRRCAFREGNSGQRIHVEHDLPQRRLRQRRRNGSARLRDAVRIDALVAPYGARRVGRIYWHVVRIYFESAYG